MRFRTLRNFAVLASALAVLAGCTGYRHSLPTSGPDRDEVEVRTQPAAPDSRISLVDLDETIVRRAIELTRRPLLSESLGGDPLSSPSPSLNVGFGDVVEISIWEAPPAALFGTTAVDPRSGLASASGRVSVMPEQVVNNAGNVSVPFAGTIRAAGRSPQQIEEEITRRLRSKANDPQVMVRVVRNQSSSVTVVGEVAQSQRMALSPRGERLLDALAAAGGTRQPVGKITLQVTREIVENGRRSSRVASLPLDAVIADPAQNILLQPGDVVTALFQPHTMTVLGATGRNEEINFEAQGITLAQALGRAGGLLDTRSNPEAVFIFRFEDPAVVGIENPRFTTTDGRIAVVYRANLREPATYFLAQNFPIRNKDILYVANAPAAELQKFLNLVSSVIVPAVTVKTLGQ